jgi:hypothetical protein
MRTVLIVLGLIGLLVILNVAATTSSAAMVSSPEAIIPTTGEAPIEPTATDLPIEPTAISIVQVGAQRVTSEPISRKPSPTATAPAATKAAALKPTITPTGAVTRNPSATEIPAVPVTPGVVNSVSIDQALIMPPAVQQNIRGIFARGQTLGRNAHSFSTAGDSTIETPYFMGPFSTTRYNLGGYGYLQPTIDFFVGTFGRDSVAVRIGQHSWSVLNPVWSDKKRCEVNESPLACEFRLNQPAVLIIRLGVNDAGVPKMFDTNLRKIVDYTIEQGVIPILSTKPDQREGTGAINDLVKQIAVDYNLPLWDYELVAKTLPGRGLGADGAHMTSYPSADYRLEAAYSRGHAMQNLTALMVLDKVRQVVNP